MAEWEVDAALSVRLSAVPSRSAVVSLTNARSIASSASISSCKLGGIEVAMPDFTRTLRCATMPARTILFEEAQGSRFCKIGRTTSRYLPSRHLLRLLQV